MNRSSPPVLYIITALELGGAQKVCLSLFKSIKSTGVPTYLIAGPGILEKEIVGLQGVTLLPGMCSFLWPRAFFRMLWQIRKLKKIHPTLIVHTHSTVAGIMGRWAAFCAGAHTRIHTVLGYGFNDYQNRFVRWALYSLEYATSFITSYYVCVSSADVRTGSTRIPGFARKHVIIRAAINWEQFYLPARKAPIAMQKGEPFILAPSPALNRKKTFLTCLRRLRAFTKSTHMRGLRLLVMATCGQRLRHGYRSMNSLVV